MFEKLLSRIGICLDHQSIPYMIIGGQAVLLYGEPRLTRDIDITLGVNIDGLDRLLNALREIPLKPLPSDIDAFVNETMVLPTLDKHTGIRVDFIFSYTPFETNAIQRAKTVTVLGQKLAFASPEDLIIHKIFAGRPRDLEDVRIILVKNADIDINYIRKWLKTFDEASDTKEFLKIFEEILKTVSA
jgi:hypothetical protein